MYLRARRRDKVNRGVHNGRKSGWSDTRPGAGTPVVITVSKH
jgi:hypothetical protein